MKKTAIGLLFLLKIFFSPGQSTNIDSLQKILPASKPDTNRVLILQELGRQYAFRQLDSSLIYVDSGIQLAKKLKYIKGEALSILSKSIYYRMTGSSAQGLRYAMNALPLFENQKDTENIILCNLLISWPLEDQQYQRLAIDYVLKIVPTAIQIKSKWLGFCYTTLCQNYRSHNMLDSALVFGLKGDTLMPNDDFNIANIGDIFLKMHKVEEAEKYLNRIIAAPGIENRQVHALNILSNFYSQKNLVDSAIYLAKEALSRSQDNKSAVRELEAAATMLKELYQKKGLKDSMLFYMNIIIAAKDKLAGQERVDLISLLFNEQLQYQEMETRQLQYEKRVQIFSLLAVLAIVLLVSLVLYRHDRQKQKANKILERTLVELKSTQSQLIQSEKMASLGELTAGIAHEIQNPLNFVNNFSEVNTELIDELQGERLKVKGERDEELENELLNDIKQNLEKINHHGKRADSIVKGMLQHSQKSTGHKEPTDINALAGECLKLSYHGLRAKDKSFNAEMKTDFDNTIGKINILPQDISRVLINIINNAFYAVGERQKSEGEEYKPTVSISTKEMSDKISISVKDNGSGIPQKIIDKIFQPFFTTKPTGQGTGLGLSLAYDIVKAHGGEIKVETKEGGGSEFIIQLPL